MANIQSLPRSPGDRKKKKAPNFVSQGVFYSYSRVSKPKHLGKYLQLVNYFITLANCSVVVPLSPEIGYF